MDRIKCLREDNRCPECGSKRIVKHCRYPLYVDIDVRTGKEIFQNPLTGKRVYRPSNRLIASQYKASQFGMQCWNYECTNCSWKSELFAL